MDNEDYFLTLEFTLFTLHLKQLDGGTEKDGTGESCSPHGRK
jgi:hypothetical protein